ncbi:MAG: hypothetical protein H6572_04085 [Lewinellaceae bacterium]|nr:hypothetical protein [Lewinellaceae bacterium]
MYKFISSIAIIGLIFNASCKEENSSVKQDLLLNHWVLKYAERNEKPTSTLQNAYINFESDSSLVSNVFSNENPIFYEIQSNELTIGHNKNFRLKIEEVTDTSLVISGQISKNDMKFVFIPSNIN